jgi:multiple sugar transport system substrate-binding protein
MTLLAVALTVVLTGAITGSRVMAAADDLKGEISVAYSATYVFGVDAEATQWWNSIKQEFETKYPGATLKLLPITGTDVDMMNKVALQFKSPTSTPDVFQLPTSYVGGFAASGYLLTLDQYVNTDAPFWKYFPKNVQDEVKEDGKVYAIVCGDNNSGLYYNIEMLKKAGITLPWKPKTWDEILEVARKVKAANPDVVTLWAAAGTSAGPTGVFQGSSAMVYGSSTPMILDGNTKKWVVDSPGLKEVFQFYRNVYSQGLGATTSDLFSPKAVGRAPAMMRDKQLAIALGSNWYGATWTRVGGSRYWPTAKEEAAAAPIPTSKGQSPGIAGTIGGWSYAIAKATKKPALAWGLMKLLQEDENSVTMATGGGFTPPSQQVAKHPKFVSFAPPFTTAFAEYISYAKPLPSSGEFAVYARGLGQATGEIAQHPETTVDQAIKILRDTVVNQLGPNKVEELK